MKPKLLIKEKCWIPIETIPDFDKAKNNYSWYQYNEMVCRSCENLPNRHNWMCDACPRNAFLGKTCLVTIKTTKSGVQMAGFPLGDKKNIPQKVGIIYSDFNIIDRRCDITFSHKIEFVGKLRKYQLPVADEFLKHKYGLIECPPRFGKTALALYISQQLGNKTLVIANQIEFLQQFERHLMEFTNLPELEKRTGKKLFGYPKTLQDFQDYEFSLVTYQQFLSKKGRKKLKKIAGFYGTVFIDEVHKASANEYSKVVSQLYPKHMFGVTATVERKDKKEYIIQNLIGPIVADSSREMLSVKVSVHKTDIMPRTNYINWNYAMQFLAKNEKRNQLIIKYVIRDIERGRFIVIPVIFKHHVSYLVDEINSYYGKTVAEPFVGSSKKSDREAILNRARSGKTKVIVGVRSIIQLGLDCPTWNCLYEIMPIANKPNLKQETSRIRTPFPGKKQPLIRFFVDPAMGQSLGCFRASYGHMKQFGYSFTERSIEICKKLVKNKSVNNRDEFHPIRTLKDESKVRRRL